MHRHYSKFIKKDSFMPVRKQRKCGISGTQFSRHGKLDRMKNNTFLKKQPESALFRTRRRE